MEFSLHSTQFISQHSTLPLLLSAISAGMVEWSAIQRNLHMRYILCIQHFSFNNDLLLTSVYLFGKRKYTGAAAANVLGAMS